MAASPEQVLSPSRAPTPPPNQHTYSRWATPPPIVPNFSLFTRAGTSESREPSQPAADPSLRPLPLQYQPTRDPRTPPRWELPRTPEREPAPEPSDSEDSPFVPGDPLNWPVHEDRWVRHRVERGLRTRDHPTGHLTCLDRRARPVGIQEVPLGDHHHHLLLLRLLRTLHRVLQGLLPSLLYQHLRTRRSLMSKRQKTSPRQKSGTVSVDKPSSTSRKIDETSTMTRRSFGSC